MSLPPGFITTIWSDGRGGAASARSAPRPHETANGEIEADEHHERDKPLIALRRTVRDNKHALGVDGRRASPQEDAKNSSVTNGSHVSVAPLMLSQATR